jgi:DNA-binding NarL/FixJ family response regulator
MAVTTSGGTGQIRVFIADDHSLFRDGLRRLLDSEPGFEVVGEASDGEMLMSTIRDARPDVLLLDVSMPRLNGMDVLRELAKSGIPVRTLLVTASIEKAQVVQALKLGAFGVILKESTSRRLFDGVRCVMAGQYWVGRESVADLVRALRSVGNTPDAGGRLRDFGLTPRELEIVALVIAGDSNADIAARCSISQQTVKHHVSNVFDKLGVSNRLELALFAINHKLAGAVSDPE